jgi:threonine dehydratase
LDLTDNELAKLHVRHLVGGPATAPNELLYRFEFPERPGALMRFLDAMSQGWNISLFHYRNHGADYGRVLAGIQVPPEEMAEFRAFLDRLGYDCVDETANPAYRMFLGR